MKKYNQFINESNYILIDSNDMIPKSEPNIKFVIDKSTNNTIDKKKSVINEIKKYVHLFSWNEDFLMSTEHAWEITLYNDIDNLNYIKIGGISYGSAVKVNLISLEDFLSVGLEGVEKYFEIKNKANKFNI